MDHKKTCIILIIVFLGVQSTYATSLYLELMKKCLLDLIYEDHYSHEKFNSKNRVQGKGFPSLAHTMIGLEGLNNTQFCVEDIHECPGPGGVKQVERLAGGSDGQGCLLGRRRARRVADGRRKLGAVSRERHTLNRVSETGGACNLHVVAQPFDGDRCAPIEPDAERDWVALGDGLALRLGCDGRRGGGGSSGRNAQVVQPVSGAFASSTGADGKQAGGGREVPNEDILMHFLPFVRDIQHATASKRDLNVLERSREHICFSQFRCSQRDTVVLDIDRRRFTTAIVVNVEGNDDTTPDAFFPEIGCWVDVRAETKGQTVSGIPGSRSNLQLESSDKTVDGIAGVQVFQDNGALFRNFVPGQHEVTFRNLRGEPVAVRPGRIVAR